VCVSVCVFVCVCVCVFFDILYFPNFKFTQFDKTGFEIETVRNVCIVVKTRVAFIRQGPNRMTKMSPPARPGLASLPLQ